MEIIHAVDMVRCIRDEHYNLVKNMNFEECKEFYHQKSEIVNSRITKLLQEIEKEGEKYNQNRVCKYN